MLANERYGGIIEAWKTYFIKAPYPITYGDYILLCTFLPCMACGNMSIVSSAKDKGVVISFSFNPIFIMSLFIWVSLTIILLDIIIDLVLIEFMTKLDRFFHDYFSFIFDQIFIRHLDKFVLDLSVLTELKLSKL